MNVRLCCPISTALLPIPGRQKIATDKLRTAPMTEDDFSQ